MIVLLRITFPSDPMNNLLILAAVVWLGPFLVKSRLVTLKRFVVLSLIWFLYDIIFVWLTGLSVLVQTKTQASQLPLTLTVNNNLMGTGDLLWSGLMISLIKDKKYN